MGRRATPQDDDEEPLFSEDDETEHAKVVVGEYWKKVSNAVDNARARAQSAYAIVNSLAVVFTGSVVLVRLHEQHLAVKIAVAVAVVVWLCSMIFYLKAVTYTASARDRNTYAYGDSDAKIRAEASDLVKASQAERSEVAELTKKGNIGTGIASIVSIAVLVSNFIFPAPNRLVTVVLKSDSVNIADSVCGRPLALLTGELNIAKLRDPLVPIESPRNCGGVSLLWLRQDDIAAIRQGSN